MTLAPKREPAEEYKNFDLRKVYIWDGRRYLPEIVTLPMIKKYWVDHIKARADEIISEKAKTELQKRPGWKVLYDKYVTAKEDLKEIKLQKKELKKEYQETEDEKLREHIERINAELSSLEEEAEDSIDYLVDGLLSVDDIIKIEPSISDILERVHEKGKKGFNEEEKRELATIAFMNEARKLGYYDFFWDMAELTDEIDIKDVPLTVYAPPDTRVQESLFRTWLETALKTIDIEEWDTKTMRQFVGDDWKLCWPDRDEPYSSSSRDRWMSCAIEKAKHTQALAIGHPRFIQPIVVETGELPPMPQEVADLSKEMAEFRKQCFTTEEFEVLKNALEEELQRNEEQQEQARRELKLSSRKIKPVIKGLLESLEEERTILEDLVEYIGSKNPEDFICTVDEVERRKKVAEG